MRETYLFGGEHGLTLYSASIRVREFDRPVLFRDRVIPRSFAAIGCVTYSLDGGDHVHTKWFGSRAWGPEATIRSYYLTDQMLETILTCVVNDNVY